MFSSPTEAGFGVAAILMLGGLATYLCGYWYLPVRVDRRGHNSKRLTPADWRAMRALIAVVLINVVQSISYYQLYNVFKVWVQEHVDLSVGPLKSRCPGFSPLMRW